MSCTHSLNTIAYLKEKSSKLKFLFLQRIFSTVLLARNTFNYAIFQSEEAKYIDMYSDKEYNKENK